MSAIRSQHSRVFEQIVAVRRRELLEAMAGGVSDTVYLTFVGQIRGLDEALKYSEEADFKLSGEEPDAGS